MDAKAKMKLMKFKQGMESAQHRPLGGITAQQDELPAEGVVIIAPSPMISAQQRPLGGITADQGSILDDELRQALMPKQNLRGEVELGPTTTITNEPYSPIGDYLKKKKQGGR